MANGHQHSAKVREDARRLVLDDGLSVVAAAEKLGLHKSTVYRMVRNRLPTERRRGRGPTPEMLLRMQRLHRMREQGLRRSEIMKRLGWTASDYASVYRACQDNEMSLAPSPTGRPKVNV